MRDGCETVKTRGYCRVCGEKIPRSRDSQRNLKGLPCIFHEISCAFQNSEGRVPFIQVTDLRFDAKRTEQPPSADPQEPALVATATPDRHRTVRW